MASAIERVVPRWVSGRFLSVFRRRFLPAISARGSFSIFLPFAWASRQASFLLRDRKRGSFQKDSFSRDSRQMSKPDEDPTIF